MRQIGTLATESEARQFTAYLVTQKIEAKFEAEADGWAIWVHDENFLDEARASFEEFRRDPMHQRYAGVEAKALSLEQEQHAARLARQKNLVDVRLDSRGATGGPRPVLKTLIGLAILVTLLTNFGDPKSDLGKQVMGQLSFCSRDVDGPGLAALDLISQGQLWRLVTPIFLHGGVGAPLDRGVIHILFNAMMCYQLGGVIEARKGAVYFLLLVLGLALCSNLCQALLPAALGGNPVFGGLSGVVYGFFGYLLAKMRLDPADGFYLPTSTVYILFVWLVICIVGIISNIANVAHVVGLVAGLLAGALSAAWRHK